MGMVWWRSALGIEPNHAGSMGELVRESLGGQLGTRHGEGSVAQFVGEGVGLGLVDVEILQGDAVGLDTDVADDLDKALALPVELHGVPVLGGLTALGDEDMLPLIGETTEKIKTLHPRKAQTGPAIRRDSKVIEKQLNALEGREKQIYKLITESIQDEKF